jgi:hypothetical protein
MGDLAIERWHRQSAAASELLDIASPFQGGNGPDHLPVSGSGALPKIILA